MTTQARDNDKRNFLRLFPKGFADPSYFAREREYKTGAHNVWQKTLRKESYQAKLAADNHLQIAADLRAVYQGLNLLASFEQIALWDALKSSSNAVLITTALFDAIYGDGAEEERFKRLVTAFENVDLARGSVVKWPVITIFPFLAEPTRYMFLKPDVTKLAAEHYDFELNYRSAPNWLTYSSLLRFARTLEKELATLKPVDLIDVQSFIWVTNSKGYAAEFTP